jgi:hypothetical protein
LDGRECHELSDGESMVKPLEFPDAPEKKLSSPASDLAPRGYLQNELVMDMRPSQAATNNYELTENLSICLLVLENKNSQKQHNELLISSYSNH